MEWKKDSGKRVFWYETGVMGCVGGGNEHVGEVVSARVCECGEQKGNGWRKFPPDLKSDVWEIFDTLILGTESERFQMRPVKVRAICVCV